MNLRKRIIQITHDSGVETQIEVLVYDDLIQWRRSERMQFHDGEAWVEEQSITDYLQKGPPGLVNDLSPERRAQVEELLRK